MALSFLGWWVGKDNKNRQPLPFLAGAVWRGKCILLMGKMRKDERKDEGRILNLKYRRKQRQLKIYL